MARRKKDAPLSLDNTPNAHLADEYGKLNTMAKDLDKRMKLLREEILSRKIDVLPGDEYTITVARSKRATIDKEKVVSEVGQAWWDARTKVSEVETITARKKEAA